MIINVYSVFDSKLATFGRPWYELTDSAAIRAFSDAVMDGSNPNNQFHKHPEDFSLYSLGSFDDSIGFFDLVKPVSLVTASALVASRRPMADNMPAEIVDSLLNSKKK